LIIDIDVEYLTSRLYYEMNLKKNNLAGGGEAAMPSIQGDAVYSI